VWALRALLLATFLVAWQWLPSVGGLSDRFKILNPFFISSPSEVATRIWRISSGTDQTAGAISVWPYIVNTVKATLVGFAVGAVCGLGMGAAMSNSPLMAQVFRPFLVAINTIPRIALIPIIVVIAGVGFTATVMNCFLIVVFLVFFAAFEGGRSVPGAQLENVQIMGAKPLAVTLRVRLPYVVLGVFSALPNAISFGLLVVVTTELLTGSDGVGSLLLLATTNIDSTLTVSLALILSILGLLMVGITDLLRIKILHWAAD
jgi:NitT/TauT family transport system permease protein